MVVLRCQTLGSRASGPQTTPSCPEHPRSLMSFLVWPPQQAPSPVPAAWLRARPLLPESPSADPHAPVARLLQDRCAFRQEVSEFPHPYLTGMPSVPGHLATLGEVETGERRSQPAAGTWRAFAETWHLGPQATAAWKPVAVATAQVSVVLPPLVQMKSGGEQLAMRLSTFAEAPRYPVHLAASRAPPFVAWLSALRLPPGRQESCVPCPIKASLRLVVCSVVCPRTREW
mmetsp:Transcript_53069/g.141887  ORF Transcript_53069/g.141887 Transcript_53069/m.141887 type:complete len:230 (+) Transcript_53069:392-1081(+)